MIKTILKGAVMGIANVIPGVSGGTMAVSMGIYDKLIHCISHFFSDFKKNMAFLIPLAIGMGIAIVGSALGIPVLFEHFPLQTNLFFVGLILGSLPFMYKNVKGQKVKFGYIIIALIFFALVVGMALLDGREGTAADLSFNVLNVIKLFGVGVVASATMVVPGVSGSMMLLLMGYYNPILSTIKEFIVALTDFNIPAMFAACGVLVPFGIGVLVGIVAIAKMIEWLFAKCPYYVYYAIIGLLVASPIGILILATIPSIGVLSVLTGIVMLVAGFFISIKLGE